MESVLQTEDLKKVYHGFAALNGVSIKLEPGRIYGLIGQNGAGKSTLMRMITGLGFPTSGSISLFGHTGEKDLQFERKRIGSIIENPGLIGDMTAKENLKFHRLMRGISNAEVEDKQLEAVGLTGTGKKKARDFSLGMKQRLGIACALLSNPEFLILDEPINGLDPVGVVEIRNLVIKLCKEQHMTILISSHNLPELYKTATDYIIIHKGEIKCTLTMAELDERCKHHLLIQCDHPDKLKNVLENKLHTKNYTQLPDKSIKLFDFLDKQEEVVKTLYKNGIIITNLSREGETLEDYFVSVIGGEKHDQSYKS